MYLPDSHESSRRPDLTTNYFLGFLLIAAIAIMVPASASHAQAPNGTTTPPDPLPQAATATLSVISNFAAPVGARDSLAGHPFLLLRESYADVIKKSGVTIPADISPYRYASTVCSHKSPDCSKVQSALRANSASFVRADVNGNATFPALPPGVYYLMIAGRFDKQAVVWVQQIPLRPGNNTIRLDQHNATPID